MKNYIKKELINPKSKKELEKNSRFEPYRKKGVDVYTLDECLTTHLRLRQKARVCRFPRWYER